MKKLFETMESHFLRVLQPVLSVPKIMGFGSFAEAIVDVLVAHWAAVEKAIRTHKSAKGVLPANLIGAALYYLIKRDTASRKLCREMTGTVGRISSQDLSAKVIRMAAGHVETKQRFPRLPREVLHSN